jgi:hypothetical protein
MSNLVTRLLQACAVTMVASSAHAAVIGFDDISGNGTPFTFHTEDGFFMFPTSGADWFQNTVYGAPAPFIQFWRQPGEPENWGSLFVRADAAADFTFSSVDVYSSVTPIPYRFIGSNDGLFVFDVYSTMPNTFGQFRTASNPEFSAVIDLLYIELANPYVAFGGNPVGLDNIVVSLAHPVPEPGSLALVFTALASIVGATSMRRRPRGSQ